MEMKDRDEIRLDPDTVYVHRNGWQIIRYGDRFDVYLGIRQVQTGIRLGFGDLHLTHGRDRLIMREQRGYVEIEVSVLK